MRDVNYKFDIDMLFCAAMAAALGYLSEKPSFPLVTLPPIMAAQRLKKRSPLGIPPAYVLGYSLSYAPEPLQQPIALLLVTAVVITGLKSLRTFFEPNKEEHQSNIKRTYNY